MQLFTALLALGPAAANLSLAAQAEGLTLLVCSGDGVQRQVTVPTGRQPAVPGDSSTPCCAKACHSGHDRKKAPRKG